MLALTLTLIGIYLIGFNLTLRFLLKVTFGFGDINDYLWTSLIWPVYWIVRMKQRAQTDGNRYRGS